MNRKKICFIFLLILGVFFFGNIEVNASTYKYCEYTLPAGTAVTTTSIWGQEIEALEEDSTLMFMYEDNSLVSLSLKGPRESYNLLKEGDYEDSDYNLVGQKDNGEGRLMIVNADQVRTGECPQIITTRKILKNDGDNRKLTQYVTDVYYSYQKTKNSKEYSFEQDLVCEYKLNNIGNRTEIPSYVDKNGVIVRNNIQVILSMNDLKHPSSSVVGSYTYGDFPDGRELYDVLVTPAEFGDDDYYPSRWNDKLTKFFWGVEDYTYLLDALEKRQCPPWLIYNPYDGKYVLSKKEITTGTAPNLYGTDDDYSIYQVDNSKFCEEKITSYEKELSDAEKELDKISTELDEHIKNKDFTQELKDSYLSRIKALDKVEENLSDNQINQYFGSDSENPGMCANDYDKRIEEIRDRKKKIKDQLISGVLGTKISQANQASEKLNDEEKEKNEKEFLDLQNYFSDLLTSISLDNFNQEQTCDTIFGDFDNPNTLGGMIQTIFNMVKIIAPILVIVLGSLDFGKAVISSDQDALKKAQSSFAKRLIAAVALFFLPILITLLLEMINTGIDPTCGIK